MKTDSKGHVNDSRESSVEFVQHAGLEESLVFDSPLSEDSIDFVITEASAEKRGHRSNSRTQKNPTVNGPSRPPPPRCLSARARSLCSIVMRPVFPIKVPRHRVRGGVMHQVEVDPSPPAPAPAPLLPTCVWNTQRSFPGDSWKAVLATSRATVERTLLNEVRAATGLSDSLIRIVQLEPSATQLTAELAFALAGTTTRADVQRALDSHPFDGMRTLMELQEESREHQNKPPTGIAAFLKSPSVISAVRPNAGSECGSILYMQVEGSENHSHSKRRATEDHEFVSEMGKSACSQFVIEENSPVEEMVSEKSDNDDEEEINGGSRVAPSADQSSVKKTRKSSNNTKTPRKAKDTKKPVAEKAAAAASVPASATNRKPLVSPRGRQVNINERPGAMTTRRRRQSTPTTSIQRPPPASTRQPYTTLTDRRRNSVSTAGNFASPTGRKRVAANTCRPQLLSPGSATPRSPSAPQSLLFSPPAPHTPYALYSPRAPRGIQAAQTAHERAKTSIKSRPAPSKLAPASPRSIPCMPRMRGCKTERSVPAQHTQRVVTPRTVREVHAVPVLLVNKTARRPRATAVNTKTNSHSPRASTNDDPHCIPPLAID